MNLDSQTTLHLAYLVGIALKGLDGIVETGSGVTLLVINPVAIVRFVGPLLQAAHLAKGLSAGALQFASFYLLAHGLVKVGLVAGLLRGWRCAYPVALALLSAFIGYQGFRLSRTHSILLALLTATDVIIVVLIWIEWRRARRGTLRLR